jgi:hypothetical protein
LICGWESQLNLGPVFAGWAVLSHAKKHHPNSEGVMGIIEQIDAAANLVIRKELRS